MTAVELDDTAPIPYAATAAGWAAPAPARTTCTLEEAVALRGWSATHTRRLCARGRLVARKLDGRWCIDVASLEAYTPTRPAASPPPQQRHLDAGPLLRHVDARGGRAGVGVDRGSAEEKALERARHRGWVTVTTADHLAVTCLGLTPWEVWGAVWDRATSDREWFATAQAAAYAGVREGSVRRALLDGVLHGEQHGSRGRWVIRRRDLDRWVNLLLEAAHHRAARTPSEDAG